MVFTSILLRFDRIEIFLLYVSLQMLIVAFCRGIAVCLVVDIGEVIDE